MKAFEKVPHRRSLYKLARYGITDYVQRIKYSVTGHQQCATLNTKYSKPAPVTSGIPQGSVLGPILFVIYINDMPQVVDKDSQIFLFADDTQVFRRIRNDNDVIQSQKDIDRLVEWSDKWLHRWHWCICDQRDCPFLLIPVQLADLCCLTRVIGVYIRHSPWLMGPCPWGGQDQPSTLNIVWLPVKAALSTCVSCRELSMWCMY